MLRRSSFSRSPSPEVDEKCSGVLDSEKNENTIIENNSAVSASVLNLETQFCTNSSSTKGELSNGIRPSEVCCFSSKSNQYSNENYVRITNKNDDHCHYSNLNEFGEVDDMFNSENDNYENVEEEQKTQLSFNPKYSKRLECEDDEGYYVSYIGEVIGNKYKVCSNSIGKGVFSSVIKCTNLNTRNEVAIKIIRLNDMMKSAGEKEFEMLKLLRGIPNVVQVQESFIHQGHFCIVFEWLNETLKSCMNKVSKHNISKVRNLAKQIFIGIKHIHDKGYIHTDIKPDNILVDSERMNFKISDFGNAIKESEATPASYLVSRFYRPPEVIIGSLTPFRKSVDIWSIGCVLYECFTGNVLFKGKSNNDMIKLIIELRGNFPKKMLKQGVFSKNHFSSDFEKLIWKNQQDMTQFINNSKSNLTIFQSISSNIQNKKELLSDMEVTLIKRLSNLIEKCLVIDPKKRISAKEALEHPFFSDLSN
ncbi:hypothetical protein FG379_002475 [Cryptosporidium bovis]|uniref:uncharacterized protein n=1 Tax=Cryptosporidium bovis TaxID=310047 RepID=UPI00351A24AE|nr:hypothetical protein FG379_002475 [Cryptosporidium bovis]